MCVCVVAKNVVFSGGGAESKDWLQKRSEDEHQKPKPDAPLALAPFEARGASWEPAQCFRKFSARCEGEGREWVLLHLFLQYRLPHTEGLGGFGLERALWVGLRVSGSLLSFSVCFRALGDFRLLGLRKSAQRIEAGVGGA